MSKAAAPQRWFSGWRAPAPTPTADAADLGTAFGLDMSLHDTLPPEPAVPAQRPPRRRGWMQRLAGRGKAD